MAMSLLVTGLLVSRMSTWWAAFLSRPQSISDTNILWVGTSLAGHTLRNRRKGLVTCVLTSYRR